MGRGAVIGRAGVGAQIADRVGGGRDQALAAPYCSVAPAVWNRKYPAPTSITIVCVVE